ncbi:dicarboxylate/amino acid:cation symporter [Sandarakinorhabdus sp.]|uniref:dicarboxylate/amino acid:cation symporter n=1 Tax=Sandarakinorhabdus sp. TaxID=1916663 RepID=UPI00286E4FD3|nr:dicarboxylate/amino acid:cation symporter [Sandarakinorhabdus sp.]
MGDIALPLRRPIHRQLYAQVLAAIIAGGLIGHFAPDTGVALKPLGDAFIKLVKLVVAPLVFLTIVTGIAHMRDMASVGRIAGKAFTYFLAVSTLALVVGLVVANVVRPGDGLNIDPAALDTGGIAAYVDKAKDSGIVPFLMGIIPDSVFSPFVDGNLLQVLFLAISLGSALALAGARTAPLLAVLDASAQGMFRLTALFMAAAPIGAFGAFAFTIGKFGLGSISNLVGLVATFYATSLLFVIVVLGLIARAAGFSILTLVRYLKGELLLVLGTSSSESALPGLMAKMERAGCPKGVVGLVVPTGYSFNLDGTNIYMTLAALFIAQATNIDLSIGDQLLLLGVAMLSSKGAAGVTGAGFITLAATLSIVPGVPVAGMALILGIDRFMSECRALTNFMGNAVACVIVSRWEGGIDEARFSAVFRDGQFDETLAAMPLEQDAD